MKQNPKTKPIYKILERFRYWVGVLERDPADCIEEAFRVYDDREAVKNSLEKLMNYKDKRAHYQFEINPTKWLKMKHIALKTYGHDRDLALSIAMQHFVDKYDSKLSEVL